MHHNFTVTITPFDYGAWVCANGQARVSPTNGPYTFLQVEVTGDGELTPRLQSFTVANSGLPAPGFMYFDYSQPDFMHFGMTSPLLVTGDFGGNYVAQPAPASGADFNNTTWSFGLVQDPDNGTLFGSQTLDYRGCTQDPFACGRAAILQVSGFAGPDGVPLSESGYGVTVVDANNQVIRLGLSSPQGVSAAGHDVAYNPLPIQNTTSPSLYDTSGNYPKALPNGTQDFGPYRSDNFTAPPCIGAPAPTDAYRAVWLDYTPNADGQETVTTFGSHFDTVVAVYTGTDTQDPQNLTMVTCGDDIDDQHVQSQVTFQAYVDSGPYHILVTEFPPVSTAWFPSQPPDPEIVVENSDGSGNFSYTCADTSHVCASPLSGDSTLYVQLTNQPQLLPYYANPQNNGSGPQAQFGGSDSDRGVRPQYTSEPVTSLYPSGAPPQLLGITSPNSLAVDAANNTVFVTSAEQGVITLISGANTTSISDTDGPMAVAVNAVTNKVYVANALGNSVTVIDGATLAASTINAGAFPAAVAVNQLTNKAYVVNQLGDSVTVVDGATLRTTTVPVGALPGAIAINQTTNMIYVANCGSDSSCASPGAVTIINGADNTTRTVNIGKQPGGIAVNPATNMIYVANKGDNNVTAINGATLGRSTVIVGPSPYAIGVNGVTNKIYVANEGDGSVTVIDGATNQTHTIVNVGGPAYALIIDEVANKIYVANCNGDAACASDGAVTVIAGANDGIQRVFIVGVQPVAIALNSSTHNLYVADLGTAQNPANSGDVAILSGSAPAPLQFVNVTPCRLVDTRNGNGPIQGGTSQSFVLPGAGGCGVPQNAAAFSLNATVVPQGRLGYLSLWPTGEDQPLVSTVNSPDGRVKANAAIVPAGYQGAVSVYVTDTTNVILDVDGYFKAPDAGTLQFYPLAPCRLVDTRNGQQGGTLQAGVERHYTIGGHCGIPSSAAAYSFNVTVLPPSGGLDYLTVWPQGSNMPVVSTLNDPTGTSVANAAIVPAGNNQATSFFAHNNNTDLLVDTNGYFATSGSGLSFYPAAPCRVLDTRHVGNGQPFVGTLSPPVNVAGSPCAPPANSLGYVFNATVVPANGPMPFLTLWPDGEGQPTVSTLNARDGSITSNMAIVPTSNGVIDAYAQGLTQLILDISGYFAP